MEFISKENYNKLIEDKQLNYLDYNIRLGQNVDQLKLFTLEVGRCKSVLTTFSMIEGYIENQVKYIYVVKNNELAEEALKRINDYCKVRGQKSLAFFLCAENKKKELKNISKYPILIITHARYKNLCVDTAQKKKIIESRETLIIDEEIQIFETLQYNLNRFEWYFALLTKFNPMMALQYNNAVAGLLNTIYTYKGKKSYNCTAKDYKNYKKEITKLKNMLTKELDAKYIKDLDIKDLDGQKMSKSNIINECFIIENFYTHTAYFETGNLYTYDNRYDFWLLKGNNILLDASGLFLYVYKLSDLFNTNGLQNRIVNRSNWKINFCNLNTTTSAKIKMVNLYEQVENHIKSIVSENDKLLIAGKKDLDDKALKNIINGTSVDYGYYGNLTGQNTWREFNKFYSLATFQTPSFVYVVKYLFYSKVKIDNRSPKALTGINDGKGSDKVYRFYNKDIEKVRVTTIVSEIYQAMGRIARIQGINAEFYLLLNDDSIKELIVKQFKNIQVKAFSLNVEFEKKERKEYNNDTRIVNGKQGDFMRLIFDIKKGKYSDDAEANTENKTLIIKKKDICELIKVDKKNLKKTILDKPEVNNFIKNNNIQILAQKIVIPY